MSAGTENYRRFSPPRTNAFYPMPSQDTMRPFCVFSQIRARSHTNTNINIPSFEWATKYLVGNSHERVFAGLVMIYSESASTVEHFTFVAVVTRGIKVNLLDGVTKYVQLVETSGNRALNSSSSSPLFGAAVAYKCHKIPQPGRKGQGVQVFNIVSHPSSNWNQTSRY